MNSFIERATATPEGIVLGVLVMALFSSTAAVLLVNAALRIYGAAQLGRLRWKQSKIVQGAEEARRNRFN